MQTCHIASTHKSPPGDVLWFFPALWEFRLQEMESHQGEGCLDKGRALLPSCASEEH